MQQCGTRHPCGTHACNASMRRVAPTYALELGAGGQAPFHLGREIRGATLVEDVARLRQAFRHPCLVAPPSIKLRQAGEVLSQMPSRAVGPIGGDCLLQEFADLWDRFLSRGHEGLGNQPGREPFEHPQPTLPPPSVELINADIDLTPQRLGVDNSQLENVAP